MRVERVGGRSTVTCALAHSPLRLLSPRGIGSSAWIFTSTLGGGLLADDKIALDVEIAEGAVCVMSTQSQTKIYRCETGHEASQEVSARLFDQSTLVWLPDAIACFSDSEYRQRHRIEMSDTASLIWLDWMTSGRRARGERWAFRSFESRTDVIIGNELIFRDALRLDKSDGPIDCESRMGRCDCFATVLLLGPRVSPFAAELLNRVSSEPATGGSSLLFAASPLPGGAVLRAAGNSTEAVAFFLRRRLNFLPALLGGDPWERKW